MARPERDRGIDLIAYVDSDKRGFAAIPIQTKAAMRRRFEVDRRWARFPGLILAYVWNLEEPSETKCFALTYKEALQLAKGKSFSKNTWVANAPSQQLLRAIGRYEMSFEKWRHKIGCELEHLTDRGNKK